MKYTLIILIIAFLVLLDIYLLDPILAWSVKKRLSELPTCAWTAITGLDDNKGLDTKAMTMHDFKANIMFPDVFAIYWHQTYTLKEGESIVLSAKKPNARYFSFITY